MRNRFLVAVATVALMVGAGPAVAQTIAPAASGAAPAQPGSPSADRGPASTGRAVAGAKLSAEQRTRIAAAIRLQNVRPEVNVNFPVSVGARVPNSVDLHQLPADIIAVNPGWRGDQFFRAGGEIVVVNHRTFRIVAVVPA